MCNTEDKHFERRLNTVTKLPMNGNIIMTVLRIYHCLIELKIKANYSPGMGIW